MELRFLGGLSPPPAREQNEPQIHTATDAAIFWNVELATSYV